MSNSKKQLTQVFVCRQHLGTKGGEGAALLPAVPPGAVVYGAGETAVLLSAVCPFPCVWQPRLQHHSSQPHLVFPRLMPTPQSAAMSHRSGRGPLLHPLCALPLDRVADVFASTAAIVQLSRLASRRGRSSCYGAAAHPEVHRRPTQAPVLDQALRASLPAAHTTQALLIVLQRAIGIDAAGPS